MKTLSNICIVLVQTSHPGNIGAAARAMKTMGLSQLRLVQPKDYPNAEATARASGADDVLGAAPIFTSLQEAVADCALVVGASARLRTRRWPQLDAREAACKAVAEAENNPVALVFGRERTGLTNDELDTCNYLLHIPANTEYSSLNLAAAVQVVCYELMMATHTPVTPEGVEEGEGPARSQEVEGYYAHLEETLLALGFLDAQQPRHLMRRLRRLYNRARLTQNEVNILRGILTASRGKKLPRD